MKRYKVVLDSAATDDLASLLTYITEQSGEQRALGYLDRIMKFCESFDTMPERFPRWRPSHPDLRIAVFENIDLNRFGSSRR